MQDPIEEAVVVLPKKIRENDSHPVWLELKLSDDFMKRDSDVNKRESGKSSLYTSRDYLEAELQCVGLSADGEKRLRIYDTSPLPVTTWSCSFPKAGIQTLNLMISLVKPNNNIKQRIFVQNHKIHVDNLLTVTWAPIVALIAPILVVVVQTLLRVKG